MERKNKRTDKQQRGRQIYRQTDTLQNNKTDVQREREQTNNRQANRYTDRHTPKAKKKQTYRD